MKLKRLHIDSYIAFTVLLQSFLVVLQQVLIAVFNFPAEETTFYRVILTAIPLSIAIGITIVKKWNVFLIVYGTALFIIILNIIVFPQNEEYIRTLALRFLLPIVIPSALCLMFLTNIEVVETALYRISWLTTTLVLFYIINYLNGNFRIEGYNMALSYGLLLPSLSLYARKNIYSLIAAAFLFIVIIAIGSRGAAIIFIVYVIYDIIQFNKKLSIPIIIVVIASILSLPLLAETLENLGITSRTLNLLMTGDIGNITSREYRYNQMVNVFWNNPIMGIGLFGDRTYLEGSYTHNLILELYLNWGIIGASFIIIFFIVKIISTLLKVDSIERNILVKFFLAAVVPLMISGSYLVDYDLGIFIGVLFLIGRVYKKNRKLKKKPRINYNNIL